MHLIAALALAAFIAAAIHSRFTGNHAPFEVLTLTAIYMAVIPAAIFCAFMVMAYMRVRL
jgi:hypothetical protein